MKLEHTPAKWNHILQNDRKLAIESERLKMFIEWIKSSAELGHFVTDFYTIRHVLGSPEVSLLWPL